MEPAVPRQGWSPGRPSPRALATVLESLASLLDVGVPLQKALQVTERVAAGALREALARVAARVREGHSLGAALEAESGLFSPVTVGLVRAGERGGGLAAALAQAAAQLERQDETVARVRAALAYPAILAVVGALSIVLMVLVVVPRFVALLGDTGAALPPATRLLLGMSTLARSHGALLLGGLAGAGVVAATFFGRHRSAWRSWALELPVAGRIRHGLATARVCRTLAALLGSGIPMLSALEVARDAAGDDAVAARLARARERVAEGWTLSAALESGAAVTASAVQLVAIGENAGRLPDLLSRAAVLEERLADQRIRTIVSVLEPALILCFAVLVAFVAAALLQGLYSLRPGGS